MAARLQVKFSLLLGTGVLWGFILIGCQPSGPSKAPPPTEAPSSGASQPYSELRTLMDSLTIAKQRTILAKVLSVAEKEGWAGAVQYCNLVADTLTTYRDARISLQRVALRYRKPKNALADSLDKAAYNHFLQTRSQESLVWTAGEGEVRYYRPIYVAMSQCLKCHGAPADLDGPALAKIRKLYPGDKATGFAQGDLRGLWKATLRTPIP